MSYSFNIRGKDKAEAKGLVAVELARVAEVQPLHARDQAQAQAAADAFIDMLADDDTADIHVAVNGSVIAIDGEVQQAAVGVSAYFVTRAD